MAKKAGVSKVSKNQKRRQKAKSLKNALVTETSVLKKETSKNIDNNINDDDNVEIIVEEIKIDNIDQYEDIISKFQTPKEIELPQESLKEDQLNETDPNVDDKEKDHKDGEIKESSSISIIPLEIPSNELSIKLNEKPQQQISKRKFMETHSVPLSDLKSISRPFNSNVNWQDVNAPDPYLHVYLKTMHNVIPIPRHWTSKKGFLSSKRGEQKTFDLPSFIKATGIQDMRNIGEDENDETLKARMRARVQPKSGQLDLDYDVLYDAFFKHQIKPQLLKYGELYYEGIDGNVDQLTERTMAQFKPGNLSLELQKALGITSGSLPPWFDNIKLLGSPPDYPNMKITDRGITYGSRKRKHSRWGILIDDLDSDSEKEDTKEEEEEEEDQLGDYEAQKGDVKLKTYGKSGTNSNYNRQNNQSDGKSRDLYKILQEKASGDQSSVYGSDAKAYDLQTGSKKRETDLNTAQHHERKKEGSARKFRF